MHIALVNFSRISPKLLRTYPSIVENLGITMALSLRLILWKSLPQSILNSHFCHCQNQRAPKLLRTYPSIVENLGITMALSLRLILWKSLPQSILNSHFCHCQNQRATFFWCSEAVSWCSQYSCSVEKNKPNNLCEKAKFDKHFNWLGKTFSLYQSKK